MPDYESDDCRGNVRVLERREFLLRWTRRLGCVLALAALSFAGYRGYGRWRETHLEKQAQEFAAHGDDASAVLVARRVLALDHRNIVVTRVMAEAADRARSPEAITWRKAVVAIEPHSSENYLALAVTALRCGQLTLAAHSLEKVTGKARDAARYHQIAGAIALGEKRTAQAEEHFAAAAGIEPKNHQAALNLATVRLTSGSAGTVDGARANLRRLAAQSDVQLPAWRALAADALAHDHRSEAATYATQLVAHSSRSLPDRLLLLEATLGTDSGVAALRDAQTLAAETAPSAAELIIWMNRRELAQQALVWSASLPGAIRDAQPVPIAIAESLSCTRDWAALSRFVLGKNWRDQDAFRFAIENHAQQHSTSGEPAAAAAADAAWRSALKLASTRPDQLASIAQLEEGWGYRTQAEEAWWLLASGSTNAREALGALQRFYKTARDSRGLLRVAKRALELNPNDFVAANNCASLGLLLHSDNSSRRLAAKLHAEYPASAALAATYAFALHTEGKTADGLKIIGGLNEAQLRDPAVAAYYVVMLVANGDTERALNFLPAAKKAALLPEEQQLLSDATQKLLGKNTAKSVARS